MNPVEAQRWVRDELSKVYPLGVFRDRTKEADPRPQPPAAPALHEIPSLLKLDRNGANGASAANPDAAPSRNTDWRIKVAGFGGQGVLMLGQVLAEAGLNAGLEVSWLPSYGPEMRSGTSNCHVRLSTHPVDSPLISRPNVLLAMNEPSLRKFVSEVEPGGYVLYNSHELPPGIERPGVNFITLPFTEIADQVGDARAGNIVMLGALLERAGILHESWIDQALKRLVKTERWLELDRKALVRGREAVREGVPA
jgi:Pyruvate/2-oxoacid:ferredoxin oxidoreductase gamma subunit